MGGGGSKQQQVSQVQLPAWVENASAQNYQFAQQVANQPYQPYGGQTVAGFSPDQLSAMDYARSNVGAYQPVYDAGISMAGQSGMYQPDQVRAGQFTDANVGAYMNPYLDQVESNALRNIQGATQLAVNKIGDQAATSRAFGGSRQGISEGVTIAEGTKQVGDLSAKLRSDAYNQAMGQINADQNRAMQASMANQSAGLQNAGRQLQAAQTMSGIADQGNAAMSNDVQRMMTLGQMQQQMEQKYLDDAYSRFTEARDYPKEQLNVLLSALGMSPYGKTQTTEQSNPTNWGGVASGVGSAVLGLAMMSDEDMKTDVQKVGKDKQTGMDVYSYRYKGDPKTYPKVVGLMADDIEEKMPGATQEVAGKKAVKFNPAVPKNRIKKA
jgi:hypothetical protein